jgi:hypothetical protein
MNAARVHEFAPLELHDAISRYPYLTDATLMAQDGKPFPWHHVRLGAGYLVALGSDLLRGPYLASHASETLVAVAYAVWPE